MPKRSNGNDAGDHHQAGLWPAPVPDGDPPVIEGTVIEGTVAGDAGGVSAQTILAEWIDHFRATRGAEPPGRVKGHLSREIKALLEEGQPPALVRKGLAEWHRRGQHPSTLASFVAAASAPAGSRRPGYVSTNETAAAGMALADRLARMEAGR